MIKVSDVTNEMTIDQYLETIKDIGFKVVYTEPFVDSDNIDQVYYVLWHYEYSILLDVATFLWEGDKTYTHTGSNIYFNLEVIPDSDYYRYTQTGGFVRDTPELIWCGMNDARDKVRHQIDELALCGTFVKQWKEVPFLSLTHYMDTINEDRKNWEENIENNRNLTRERLAKFPQEILNCIGKY